MKRRRVGNSTSDEWEYVGNSPLDKPQKQIPMKSLKKAQMGVGLLRWNVPISEWLILGAFEPKAAHPCAAIELEARVEKRARSVRMETQPEQMHGHAQFSIEQSPTWA